MYKLKLTADEVRILIAALDPGADNIEAITIQLEDFLSDIEFNETVNECEIDSFENMDAEAEDEGYSL
jgi:hypothetical protein